MISERSLLKARENLTDFVRFDQPALDWVSTVDAPETYERLVHTFRDTGLLCVSSENCENTIYMSPRGNMAFRAWHDSLHLLTGEDFSVAGEVAVALLHIKAVSKAFGANSLEARLMGIDTMEQLHYHAVHGRHVANQLQFARMHLGMSHEHKD